MKLQQFLDAKPLYYTEIDYTRMPRAYESIKNALPETKTIHLIGTNGKGTTGRFLVTALHRGGFKVVHYTSPHILEFNERIWLDGANISDEQLEDLHEELQNLLAGEFLKGLSYFEYTTFLAILAARDCDYLILEAGLGGEYDATAVFPKELTLVTPIDKDHEAFLGDTVESIATTKLNAVQKKAILAKQLHKSVYEVAQNIAEKKSAQIKKVQEYISEEDEEKITYIQKQNNLAEYLVDNLRLSIAALKELGLSYSEESFLDAKLFGRLTKIADNILLDVGHNTLAARSIARSLAGEKYTLVYNSYKDKDYKNILTILKPIIKEVEVIAVDEERIETDENMRTTLGSLQIPFKNFAQIEAEKNYLVFGSFSVAEAFLKGYNG